LAGRRELHGSNNTRQPAYALWLPSLKGKVIELRPGLKAIGHIKKATQMPCSLPPSTGCFLHHPPAEARPAAIVLKKTKSHAGRITDCYCTQ
jgi:hypothetical protein